MRRPMPTPLFVASVITIALAAVSAYFILAILGFQAAKAEPLLHTVQPTLPQRCSHLLREPDPDTWDVITETYPRNIPWENCMGVSPK